MNTVNTLEVKTDTSLYQSKSATIIAQITELSLQSKAKIAGFLYLVIFLGGFFAVGYIPAALYVTDDPVATTQNILSNVPLYRTALAVQVLIVLCNIPLVVLFHDLFSVANKSLARIISLFILVAASIEAVTIVYKFIPLILLRGDLYNSVGVAKQLQTIGYLPLQIQDISFLLGLTFVGCYCLLAGYLIIQLRLLPRVVGVLLAVGGACYIINGFANFISPDFAATLFPLILLPSALGEASLTLSLLFSGFNVKR